MSNSPRSKFVEHTVALWQPRTPRVLADEDARAITENVVGFFALLERWDAEQGAKQASVDDTQAAEPATDAAAPTSRGR